ADATGVISPLTTLVQQVAASSGISSADAEKIVKDQTGITVSLFADYTKTRADDPASAGAGVVARTIVVTTQEQIKALSGAIGASDGSGSTISKADLDKAVADAVAAVLSQLVTAAGNATVQDACAASAIGSAACTVAVTAAADALVAQTNLNTATLPVLVGVSKQLAGAAADPSAAPAQGASLDYALFGDADNWSYRIFVSSIAENTPDANGLTHFRDVRRQTVGGALTEWTFNSDPDRKDDAHWNGTAWVNCPFGFENTQTVRDAAGRNTVNYCDNYQLSNGRRIDVDISGKPMSDIVATLRSFPSSANAYSLWGTAPAGFTGTSTFDVGIGTFPPNSKLRYQTTTPSATAIGYDVRDSNAIFVYSAAVAAGGDSRTDASSACNSSETAGNPAINAGTLETLIDRIKGTPCLYNAGSFTVGSTTFTNPHDPSAWWGNSTLSIGVVGSVSIGSTPTAYFTGNSNIRVAFTGSGVNPVTYFACQQRFVNGSSRECMAIGTGSYSIATLGDGRALTLSNPPAQAATLTYNRVFVERGGKVYYGYRSKLIPSQQIRLNLEAANAVFAKAGVPAVTP
ncbi:MAG: hypothetical protein M3Y55_03920, partial [Pseudomonadota bacterium]|nr:hypothetical protein [Pseudomonadota bacterium]